MTTWSKVLLARRRLLIRSSLTMSSPIWSLLLQQLRNLTDPTSSEHQHLVGTLTVLTGLVECAYHIHYPLQRLSKNGERGRTYQQNAAHSQRIWCHIRPSVPPAPEIVQTGSLSWNWYAAFRMFHTVMLVIPIQPVDLSPGELLYYSVVQFYKAKTNANGVSGFFLFLDNPGPFTYLFKTSGWLKTWNNTVKFKFVFKYNKYLSHKIGGWSKLA